MKSHCLFVLLIFNILCSEAYAQQDSVPGSDFITIKPNYEVIIPEFLSKVNNQSKQQFGKLELTQITEEGWNYLVITYNGDTIREVSSKGKSFVLEEKWVFVKARTDKDGCLKRLKFYSYEILDSKGSFVLNLKIKKRGNQLRFIPCDHYFKERPLRPDLTFNDLENFLSLLYL